MKTVSLRPAVENDAEILFKWHNDLAVRKNSFDQRETTFDEHEKWLKSVLEDSLRCLFIVLDAEGTSIGQVRFDINKRGEAEISISIGPEYRGHGYGTEAISFGSKYFLENFPKNKKVIARIKKENVQSVRAFLKAGYKKININGGIMILEFTL